MTGMLMKSKGEDIDDDNLLKMEEDELDELGDLLNDDEVNLLINDPFKLRLSYLDD
jgi:hypothetical protein